MERFPINPTQFIWLWLGTVTLTVAAATTWRKAKRLPFFRPKFSDVERQQTWTTGASTTFAGFDDYWQPFLGGTGPAPSYVMSLDPAHREALRERLMQRLRVENDGTIRLRARAWAVAGRSPASGTA